MGVKNENSAAQEENRKSVQELLYKQIAINMASFLTMFTERRGKQGVRSYSFFAFELLQNLHLQVSKLMQECIVR